MSSENLSSDIILLRGVGYSSKARSMVKVSKPQALKLLNKGVELIFKALEMEPNNFGNKSLAIRHLLGISIHSPLSFYDEIEDIIAFFNKNFNLLTNDERACYLTGAGEYYLHIGEEEKGLRYLDFVSRIFPGSTTSEIARLSIELQLLG